MPRCPQIFFEELDLEAPDVTLDLRTSEIATLEAALRSTVSELRPDAVLVYGDTNSTLAGARASADCPVAHVEAGLRSGDLTMPEERNRIEVDRVSALLFAPDERSADDAPRGERPRGDPRRRRRHGGCCSPVRTTSPASARGSSTPSALEPGAYVLATVHREANVRPERLHEDHRGPRRLVSSRRLRRSSADSDPFSREQAIELPPAILLIDALGYLDFAALASQAAVIATDSGGLQKEAYWYGVPCVTMRPSTEWVDTVHAGANVLVDDDPVSIAAEIERADDSRRSSLAVRRRPRLRANRDRPRG